MLDPDGSESMDTSRSSRSSSPDTPTSSDGFPPLSPATLPFLALNADPLSSSQSFKDEMDINAWPILAAELATATSPPFLFNELALPLLDPREVFDITSLSQDDFSTSAAIQHTPHDPLMIQIAPPPTPTSTQTREASPSYDVPSTPSDTSSSAVALPPKEACSGLTICFPNLSANGVKSRVETQIKVVMDLATLPLSPTSSEPYLRVGSWKWLRLPPGCANGRRLRKNNAKLDAKEEDTLYLGVEIHCVSSPHLLVTACSSCQAREAKRVARKIAARVRPVYSDGEEGLPVPDAVRSTFQQENLDSGIVLFNCADMLDFSAGTINLPLRITCYCRHHRERVGFCITFSLRDSMGRLVGAGTTPPIMITDDHKTFYRTNTSADLELEANIQSSGLGLKRAPQTKRKTKVKPYEISRSGATKSPQEDSRASFEDSQAGPSSSPQFKVEAPGNAPFSPSDMADNTFLDRSQDSGPSTPPISCDNGNDPTRMIPSLTPSRAVTYSIPRIQRLIPSSGPTHGGVEITVLGSNFSTIPDLHITFGGCRSSFTQRWSDNTLVCLLPPRSFPGEVEVGFDGISLEYDGVPPLFTYRDESDRALMELALQVVGLKMTGKIEDAKDVAMRIVGNSGSPEPNPPDFQVSDIMQLSTGPLDRPGIETSVLRLLTLLDLESPTAMATQVVLERRTPSGHTLLHLSTYLRWQTVVSFLTSRGADLNSRDANGFTPLHFAVMAKWQAGVELLLRNGADPGIVDAQGKTALESSPDSDICFPTEYTHSDRSVYDSDDGDDADIEDEPGLSPSAALLRRSNLIGFSASPGGKPRQPAKRLFRQDQDIGLTRKEKEQQDMGVPGKDVISRLRAALTFQATDNATGRWHLPQLNHIPNLPLLQLPQLSSLPDIALSQIPSSLPIYVAIPSLSSIPWPQTSKRGSTKQAEQSEQAMAWTSWLAYVPQVLNRSTEPPPEYCEAPNMTRKSKGETRASASTPKALRKSDPLNGKPNATHLVKVGHQGTFSRIKNDCMLFCFWLPILLVGFIWGALTSIPAAGRVLKTVV